MGFRFVYTYGHWTVYHNGKFFCSADTYEEAVREVENCIY